MPIHLNSRVSDLVIPRQGIRIHIPKERSEGCRLNIIQCDARHRSFRHGAEELCLEDRRAGGEHSPVSSELLAIDEE
jgi:hypothetical protein